MKTSRLKSEINTPLLAAGCFIADGILALNSAIGGEFGIGGTVASGIDGIPLPPIPEPETYAMWLAGLGLLGFLGYRRRIKAVNPLSVSSIAH